MDIQEVRTEPVASDELRESVPEIAEFLSSWGFDRVSATYGFGCNLPMDQLWRPTVISTQQLASFVERSVQQGIVQLGRCDLHFEDLQETVEFMVCHESDVHFASVNRNQVDQVIKKWAARGLALYASPGPKGSALPKQWIRIEHSS